MKKIFFLSFLFFSSFLEAATITKSIGTASRDYSTIAAWELDLESNVIYADGDIALGEMYNDSVFNETVSITRGQLAFGGGNITPQLSVVAADRHDGTAGTGARFVASSTAKTLTVASLSTHDVILEWFEWDGGSLGTGSEISLNEQPGDHILRRLILHNVENAAAIRMIDTAEDFYLLNTVIYDVYCSHTGNQNAWGLRSTSNAAGEFAVIQNVTIDRIKNEFGTGNAFGMDTDDDAGEVFQNITISSVNASGGTASCYTDTNYTLSTVNDLFSSDTSASGTGATTSVNRADQFLVLTVGSEDYHIKTSTATIYEAGTDLGTTNQVNIDLDGFDRDAGATTWSVGAFDGNEFRGGGGGAAAGSGTRKRRVRTVFN